jgi:hypothetical protein
VYVPAMSDSSRFGPVLFGASVAGSLLLVGMGIFFACDHTGAAAAYGVSLAGGPDNAWISSAALRDLAFGSLALTFALLRDRRAMGLSLLFGAIIPIGDGVVVLRNSPMPWEFLPLHWGGAVVCLILAIVLLRSSRRGPG